MKRAPNLPHWPRDLPAGLGRLRGRALLKIALAMATTAVLVTLVVLHLDYYQIGASLEQFRVGQPAPRDVEATRTIVWRNDDETERLRRDAESRVPPVYIADPTANTKALDDLDTIFSLLGLAQLTPAQEEQLAALSVRSDVVDSARLLDAPTLQHLRVVARGIVGEVMSGRIEEGREQQAVDQADMLAGLRATDLTHIRMLSVISRGVIARHPNWVKDAKRTDDARLAARRAVPTQYQTFKPGAIVIRRGAIVSAEDFAQLRKHQLLVPAPFVRLAPIIALMLLLVGTLGLYLRTFCRAVYDNDRKLLLLAGLIAATLWAAMTLGGSNDETLVGLMAIPAGAMAIAGLLGVPSAIVSALVMAVTAGLTADHQFTFVLLTLGSALAGMLAVPAIWPASRALPAVLSLVAVNWVLLVSLQLIQPGTGTHAWAQLGTLTLWAGAGGLGATFIAVGAIYMLARPFGITTHYRLMELANPNEALLRRMMLEAPGTYHSSVMVANIAEAAADAIGANALLTRVAALYHDIGKLKRPAFFVENQAPLGIDNVHQRLSPKLSYLILTSHVRDGAEMARQYKLPEEVAEIIRQHHGTTLAAYFYHRALSDAGGEPVSEHDFRYPGPKPSTREAAVVMLSDSVQASVKAIKEPSPSRIEGMVQDIITNRLEDGQLEDCAITLRDLKVISEVFIRILSGLYSYTRIEYPDIKREGTRTRANANSETTPAASDPKVTAPGG